MITVNLWVALSTTARDAINTRLDWDENVQGAYAGPVTETEANIFRRMIDRASVERMFRTATFSSKSWIMYSLYFDLTGAQASALQDALDYLAANRPGHFVVAGAWHFDGRQVGTQFIYDGNGNVTGVTGAPTYPIPTAQLLKLMPTIKTFDANGNISSETEPVDLTDINLMQGQAQRRFS